MDLWNRGKILYNLSLFFFFFGENIAFVIGLSLENYWKLFLVRLRFKNFMLRSTIRIYLFATIFVSIMKRLINRRRVGSIPREVGKFSKLFILRGVYISRSEIHYHMRRGEFSKFIISFEKLSRFKKRKIRIFFRREVVCRRNKTKETNFFLSFLSFSRHELFISYLFFHALSMG